MAGMEGLGRLFNVVPIAAGKSVSLRNAAGVTFILTGADTFTVKSQPSAGGSATNLATVTRYYQNTKTDGTGVWSLQTQAAGASVTLSGTQSASVYIDESDLPAAAEYVEVTVAASGLVTAIVHDLQEQRDPANLVALNA